jgi:hypothetical protein
VFLALRGHLRRGALLLAVAAVACGREADRGTLPTELSSDAFWTLSTELSEAAGTFRHSDNLVSNELLYVHAVQRLRARGGVYVGVGPEQNFSYIARLEPAMAFIIDIRQENRNLHLLYKALFETSRDRVEFVARLFSRQRPAGLGDGASVGDVFAAVENAAPSAAILEDTTRQVHAHLLDTHKFPLPAADLASIDDALKAFFAQGPAIHYGWSRPGSDPYPSYRTLMTATDLGGRSRSYLASDDSFGLVRDLHRRNLIVPVVGDFGSTDGAIDRVGDYVRQRGSRVSAFYSSNVEVYLSNRQATAYCRSLANLPVDAGATFISNKWLRPFATKIRTCRPRTTLTWDPEKR